MKAIKTVNLQILTCIKLSEFKAKFVQFVTYQNVDNVKYVELEDVVKIHMLRQINKFISNQVDPKNLEIDVILLRNCICLCKDTFDIRIIMSCDSFKTMQPIVFGTRLKSLLKKSLLKSVSKFRQCTDQIIKIEIDSDVVTQ